MRLWVVLCVAVLWDTASLQPTKDKNDPERECCPCPKDSTGASTNILETTDGKIEDDQAFAGTSNARTASALGGCPCQLRSADAEGAPSAFLPAAVRALRPFVSLDDSKEDPKPLLHPEVDLASSVLDTLREATNEEYEDALARDAARAAQEPDEVAAESAPNMVTVIINPKDTSHDDVMPEASHAHEARCISPLGRSSLSLKTPAFDSPDLLADILRLPKRQPTAFRAWNLFDMDNGVGASNVNEQVVEPTFNEANVETPKTSILKFSMESNNPKSTLNLRVPYLFKNINGHESVSEDLAGSILNSLKQSKIDLPKLEIPHISKLNPRMDTSKLFRKTGDDNLSVAKDTINAASDKSPTTFRLQIPRISNLLPQLDSSSPLRKTEDSKLSQTSDGQSQDLSIGLRNSGADSESTLKLDIPNLKATISSDDISDSDITNSASTIQERYSNFAKTNTANDNVLDTNALNTNDFKMPAVKSVELKNAEIEEQEVPTTNKIKMNLKIPDLKLRPSKSRDATTDLLNNLLKGLQIPNFGNLDIFNARRNDPETKSTEQKEVAEEVPDTPFETEILDTVPSPTITQTNKVSVVEKQRDDDINNRFNEEMQNIIEEMPVKTEILDSLPKSSEVTDIDDVENSQIGSNEVDIETNDLMNGANPQIEKGLNNDEENSELVNEIEDMNEESTDFRIDETNISGMERGDINNIMEEDDIKNIMEEDDANNIIVEGDSENIVEDFNNERNSLDEIGKDDFSTEEKIDGLAINSDIQSLETEKSVAEPSVTRTDEAFQLLRERLRQRIEKIKQAPKVSIELPKLISDKNSLQGQSRSESQNEETIINEHELENDRSNENFDQVNIEDLQQMSDSLLNHENTLNDDRNIVLAEPDKPELSNIESSDVNDVETTDNIVLDTNNRNALSKVDDACIVKDTSNKILEDKTIDSKNNEMAAGASERVASITGPDLNDSPLRQTIIFGPPALGPSLNLFNRPGLNIRNHGLIPGIRLPGLLKSTGDGNINLFSSNDNSENIQEPKSLSGQASTPSFRSSLPPLQPLEDINLDILQLKPLSADMPTLPRLNLNSFKTRLALPKSLDLKPVLLESSVGNKKGVVGATLTLGSDKDLDRSKLLQEASASIKSSNILGQSLGSLPSLNDLHESLWENTQNLLSTPLETTGRNVVEDTLRSSQVLTDNLRVQAENTVKDLQQNLASTFRGTGLRSSGLGSLRGSGDLLEEISRRHEDVNDRLKGISVDLSDRLESFRDNLLDQYRIPSLGSSLLGQSSLFPFRSADLGFPKLDSSSRMNTKPSQNTLKFSSKGKFVIPESKRKSSSRASSNKSKLKADSSITTPKAIKIPKLRTAATESKGLKALRKESTLKTPKFLSRDRSTSNQNLIDFNRPLLKKPRIGQSKVTISFSTTPRPPILRSKPLIEPTSKLRTKPLSLKDTLSTLSRSGTDKKGSKLKLNSLRDSSGFASEAIPSRVKAPIQKPGILRSASVDTDRMISNSISTTTVKPVINLSLPKLGSTLQKTSPTPVVTPTSLFKPKSLVPDDTAPKSESVLRNSDVPKIPALSWPKTIDDEFLTKVREALRARLAEIGKKTIKAPEVKLERVEPINDDMARSASTDIEVISPQTMKENTAYTCKMMCTKNT